MSIGLALPHIHETVDRRIPMKKFWIYPLRAVRSAMTRVIGIYGMVRILSRLL